MSLDAHTPPDAVSYAMRAESQTDAFAIRAVLSPWVASWTELWFVDDGIKTSPDIKIDFVLGWNPPSFPELQWLIYALPDCHVAAESLRPAKDYTGDRTSHEKLFASMATPSRETLASVHAALKRTRDWLPILDDVVVAELSDPRL